MKQPLLTLALILLCRITSFSQTDSSARIIALHPSVGMQISCDEKKRYCIFPEYSDYEFDNAELLKLNDSTYSLAVHTIHGKTVTRSISREELDGIYDRINKIDPPGSEEVRREKAQQAQKRRQRQESAESTAEMVEFSLNMFIITLEVLAWVCSDL